MAVIVPDINTNPKNNEIIFDLINIKLYYSARYLNS